MNNKRGFENPCGEIQLPNTVLSNTVLKNTDDFLIDIDECGFEVFSISESRIVLRTDNKESLVGHFFYRDVESKNRTQFNLVSYKHKLIFYKCVIQECMKRLSDDDFLFKISFEIVGGLGDIDIMRKQFFVELKKNNAEYVKQQTVGLQNQFKEFENQRNKPTWLL